MYHLYDVLSEFASPIRNAEDSTFWTRYTPFPFLHSLTLKISHRVCRAETLLQLRRRILQMGSQSARYSKSQYQHLKEWAELQHDTIPQLHATLIAAENYMSTYEEWPSIVKRNYTEWKLHLGELHWLILNQLSNVLVRIPSVVHTIQRNAQCYAR